jgi:ribonucleoside-diphosphate reductase alpha chain
VTLTDTAIERADPTDDDTPAVSPVPTVPRRQMRVRKRNGDLVDVDVNKIVRALDRCADDLTAIDPLRVATKTISGLYDGASTAELDLLSIRTAAELLAEEPEYSKLAARLLAGYIDKEVRSHGVASFSQSIAVGHREGLIGEDTAVFVQANARKLDQAVDVANDRRFEYFGLRTVYIREYSQAA